MCVYVCACACACIRACQDIIPLRRGVCNLCLRALGPVTQACMSGLNMGSLQRLQPAREAGDPWTAAEALQVALQCAHKVPECAHKEPASAHKVPCSASVLVPAILECAHTLTWSCVLAHLGSVSTPSHGHACLLGGLCSAHSCPLERMAW